VTNSFPSEKYVDKCHFVDGLCFSIVKFSCSVRKENDFLTTKF